jgi:PPK2 family polyphosphate:nucleotide phosphotransferase
MNYAEKFLVPSGRPLSLAAIDPAFKNKLVDKDSAQPEIDAHAQRLTALQYRLYAAGERSVLICLQALDAGGKDGTIRHVLGAMNPQGVRVHAFKQPTPNEARHDFLWRAHVHAPCRGEVAVFNRSHYEDVLVPRVHDQLSTSTWHARCDQINDFERTLIANGTRILKFYLHISPDEQLRRFKQRLDDPARQWKISEADYAERPHWKRYISTYEEVLARTSSADAPWFVIPADHKWFRNLAISEIVATAMEALDIHLPATRVDLDEIRRKYHGAAAKAST